MSPLARIAVPLLLLPVAALATGGQDVPPAAATGEARPVSTVEERVSVRLVERRIRILPEGDRDPAPCRALGLSDLRVTLRGEPVEAARLLELERTAPGSGEPLFHALLLDTSGSMRGDLDDLRDAARAYLDLLDPERERAMVLTFDETIVLVQPPTGDVERLRAAIDDVRMGGWTALRDGVRYAVEAMRGEPGRPVLVVMTDGADSQSLYDRYEVVDLIDANPDLTVFTIGLKLPPIRAGRNGVSPMKFLAQLALESNGRFYPVWAGEKLTGTFAEIRDLLENDAVLTALDDRPELEPAPLRVRSTLPGCKVEELELDPGKPRRTRRSGIELAEPRRDDAGRWVAPPSKAYRDLVDHAPHPLWKEGCLPDEAEAGWLARRNAGDGEDIAGIRGCLLDLALAGGYLHDAWNVARASLDVEPVLAWRPVDLPAFPAPDALPTDLVDWMDALGAAAAALPEEAPRTSPLKRPAGRYARPHVDHPLLVHGRTFLDLRPELARVATEDPAWSAWAGARLAARRRARVDARVARLLEERPGLVAAEVRGWVESAARDRGELPAPGADDPAEELQTVAAAWLGDEPAHTLFARWELRQARRTLTGASAAQAANAANAAHPAHVAFERGRRALYSILRLPSYVRVVAPLLPLRDPRENRVGYRRILLPRPSWVLPRLRAHRDDSEWADLPLDLLPDRPYGYRLLRALGRDDPARFDDVASLDAIRYALRGKLHRRDPRKAFETFAVTVEYTPVAPGPRRAATFEVTAEQFDALEAAEADVAGEPAGDAVPEAWRRAWEEAEPVE